MENIIFITIQHFEGCPNGPKMINNVKTAMSSLPFIFDYKEQLIETNDEAARVHFRGSPTLLINGIDFENTKNPCNPSLTCRIYIDGIPSPIEISKKIVEIVENKNIK